MLELSSNPGLTQEADQLEIMAVGDLNLAHWITPILKTKGEDYPFKKLKSVLSTSDLVIANLEAPFTLDGEAAEKQFIFKVPPEYVSTLKAGNIKAVSLANNHILDYGPTGLRHTIQTLSKAGIFYAGAGENKEMANQPAVFEIKNKKIAFFAYSMTFPESFFATDSSAGTAYPVLKIVKKEIQQVRKNCDIIITAFHWGKELESRPDQYQQRLAHKVIDYGSDVVIGHHPHSLQGVESYRGKPIFYSLGNFVFASYSEKVKQSMIAKIAIDAENSISVSLLPINVYNREIVFQPLQLQGAVKAKAISAMQDLSSELNNGAIVINDDGTMNLTKKWSGLSE